MPRPILAQAQFHVTLHVKKERNKPTPNDKVSKIPQLINKPIHPTRRLIIPNVSIIIHRIMWCKTNCGLNLWFFFLIINISSR